jgi:hypothetical protein
MVYTYPDEDWRSKPILIIHISKGHVLEGDSVYPMELLALICALRMAKFLNHHHCIVSDSQSSIDTVKPVLGETHHHFKNYSHAHITIGSRGALPDPHRVTITKVKSHVEQRKRNRSEWTQHEEGNVLADIAASTRPDQLKERYPTSINIAITASELVFQITPPDVWNIYKSPMTPVPWNFITKCHQTRAHTQYLKARTVNSAIIHRNRDWTQFNMKLAAEIWQHPEATITDRQRSIKIMYNLYWQCGNRSKDQRLTEIEQQEIAKCPLCDAPESQEHIVLRCSHPIMQAARDCSKRLINKHHEEIVQNGKGPYRQIMRHCVDHWETNEVQDNIDMWIGRWHVNDRKTLLNRIPEAIANRADLLCKAIKSVYRPITAYVYYAHATNPPPKRKNSSPD